MNNSCLSCKSHDLKADLSDLTSVYSRSSLWDIVQCCECGLLQTSPRPTAQQLHNVYSESYSYVAHDMVEFEKRRRAQGLIRASGIDFSGKSVLDIGCGSGVLLGQLQMLGAQVFGCEVSPLAAGKARQELGEDAVTVSSVEDYLDQNSALPEIVILSHCLEHLLNPLQVLDKISGRLPPNGKLLLVVPNADRAPRGRFKRHWGYWQVPVHIVHFTEQTLKHMLLQSGFVPVEFKFRNGDFLSIGLMVSNVLGLTSQQATPKESFRALISTLSTVWSFTYPWGSQDLIAVAVPREA